MKTFEVRVTETALVLNKRIEANSEEQAIEKLKAMKEDGKVFWAEPVKITAKEIYEETKAIKVPKKGDYDVPKGVCKDRDVEWIVNRTEQILFPHPESVSEYIPDFENSIMYRHYMTDMEYSQALANFIKDHIYTQEAGEDGKWNIEGIAKAVVREMKEDGAKEDELDYYIKLIVYTPVKNHKPEDADDVSSKVRARVEGILFSEWVTTSWRSY